MVDEGIGQDVVVCRKLGDCELLGLFASRRTGLALLGLHAENAHRAGVKDVEDRRELRYEMSRV